MTELVDLSRRACRALQLGKGMFFDADSMALLAEIGAIELLQQRTAEHLKEEAVRRRAEREERHRPLKATADDGDDDGYVAPPRASGNAREAFDRAQRALGTRRRGVL